MQDWTPREHYTAEDLVEIIRILRDGENGCPWDKVQTHASIRKNFLEETCEALEAIDADDPVMMQEELGDVLMQVVFHTVIEEERGRFDMEKVCREVCEKLVFRHPNIFASSAAENAGINSWDALKNKEKGRTTLADELDTVPATLPALMRAQKLQKRAARFGCGPEDAADAARTLDSAKAAWDAQQTAENAGELLLAAAGPLANLLACCTVLLYMQTAGRCSYGGYWFACTNLLVGGANLLPLPGLDGAHILHGMFYSLDKRHRI